jgi:hypothetical protein
MSWIGLAFFEFLQQSVLGISTEGHRNNVVLGIARKIAAKE